MHKYKLMSINLLFAHVCDFVMSVIKKVKFSCLKDRKQPVQHQL